MSLISKPTRYATFCYMYKYSRNLLLFDFYLRDKFLHKVTYNSQGAYFYAVGNKQTWQKISQGDNSPGM